MRSTGADPGVDWVPIVTPIGFGIPTKQLKISHEGFAQRLCTLASRVLEST